MLTEDKVLDAVASYVLTSGWRILSRAGISQHGVDLRAQKGPEHLEIEAKGAWSSRVGSARHGKAFNSGQVFDHVAKAVLKALQVTAKGGARAGIALPDDPRHRREIERVMKALSRAGIAVFWVQEDRSVRVDGPWSP